MSLHVLLADDSVPAQNMGKKILIDAGYDVLTASNGLEALRKIAERAPDIAILDIFMPGYTGLEICERLRGKAATEALPVILTVGKLEPYRPEDGEHVRSNAVIVKPFAANELISAVRSLIGRPEEAVVAPPEADARSLSQDMGGDPPHGDFADAGVVFPNPLVTEQPASLGQPAPQAEVLDEPMFSYAEAPGNATPFPPPEPVVSVADLSGADLSGAETNGLESLVFNPDAQPTPFSASALDLVASTSAAETGSAFTEFDLEPEANSLEPEPLRAVIEEPSHWAPGAGVDSPDREVIVVPEFAPEEIVSGLVATELKPASVNSAVLDPLLEMTEADAPSAIPELKMDAVQPLETLAPEVAAVSDEAVSTSSAGLLAQDEEARRLAFEELYNSTDPFPLDDFYVSPATVADTLPNIAEPAKDHPDEGVLDSEIESLIDDSQSEFTAPELDPYLMEEVEHVSAIGDIPDRDPLLDDLLGEISGPETESIQEPEQETASTCSELDSPLSGELAESSPASSLIAPPAEAQYVVAEAAPFPAEAFETVQDAGIAQNQESAYAALEPTAAEAELPQLVLEATPSEAQQTAQVSAITEAHFEAEEAFTPVHPAEIAQVVEIAEATEAAHSQESALAPSEPAVAEVEPPESVLEVMPAEAEQTALEPVIAEAHFEAPVEAAQIAEVVPELVYSAPELHQIAPEPEPVEVEPDPIHVEAELEPVQLEAAPEPTQVEQPEPLQLEVEAPPELVSALPELAASEPVHPQPAVEVSSSPEAQPGPSEAERVNQAVERVFYRFKRLLVAAIVRELARND